ncbi:MAG: hypothetical protein FJX76_16180 [Armatimonadetes bacterium]|nr:hypothetical protein [Armatimonadota bacterium]
MNILQLAVSMFRPAQKATTLASQAPPPDVSYTREDPRVQKAAAALLEVAFKADDPYRAVINPRPVKAHVDKIADRRMLAALRDGFSDSLERETQSTYRLGAMAGARCNMMRIYTTIVKALNERLKEQ